MNYKNIAILTILAISLTMNVLHYQQDEHTTLIELMLGDAAIEQIADDMPAYGYAPVTQLVPVATNGLVSKYADIVDRDDALRLYMGLSLDQQQDSTFAAARYDIPADNPVAHREGDQVVRLAHPENLKPVKRDARNLLERYEQGRVQLGHTEQAIDALCSGEELLAANANGPVRAGIMSNYTIRLAQDSEGRVYVSYNDVWDLGGSAIGSYADVVANTFSVYGRIYR